LSAAITRLGSPGAPGWTIGGRGSFGDCDSTAAVRQDAPARAVKKRTAIQRSKACCFSLQRIHIFAGNWLTNIFMFTLLFTLDRRSAAVIIGQLTRHLT
jgi:hypothetical protein